MAKIHSLQEDVLYLYKAMEALINSNQSNPVDKTDNATATTSVADAPLGSSSGQSSLVPPERRHSTSASDWSPNGSVLKKTSLATTGEENGHCRRHSLPNGNGCMPLQETTSVSADTPGASNNEEEEEEEISETAALTAV